VVGPLLALIGVELRRSIVLASSGGVALALLGLTYPQSVAVAFMAVVVLAAARTAALLAAASAATAMRTVDLAPWAAAGSACGARRRCSCSRRR